LISTGGTEKICLLDDQSKERETHTEKKQENGNTGSGALLLLLQIIHATPHL
jgi:hypothetical protein